MINICKLIICCDICPFQHECNLSFDSFRPKEEWEQMLKEKLENIQIVLDKLNEM